MKEAVSNVAFQAIWVNFDAYLGKNFDYYQRKPLIIGKHTWKCVWAKSISHRFAVQMSIGSRLLWQSQQK